jgi:hypothetical protein
MAKTSGQLEKERLREKSQIIITDFTTCHFCKSTGLNHQDHFCPNCAFPQLGTQAEMKNFKLAFSEKQKLLDKKKKAVAKARNILYILAGLNLAFGVILALIEFNLGVLIINCFAAGVYFSLGLWSRKQPFPAILSGFFVYIVFNVISGIADPSTIYQGVFLKVLIISGFVYGYKGVKESQKLEEEIKLSKSAINLSSTSDL